MNDLESEIAAQPNDAFFKGVFSDPEYAAAFFQGHLPAAVTQSIDWKTLTLLPSSYVKQDLHQAHSDLLFTVKAGKSEVLLYLLFEHQTTVDPHMPLRLMNYITQILVGHAEQCGLPLPVVLPFVLHQGPDRWTVPVDFEALFDLPPESAEALLPYVPKFRHALLDLSRFDPENEEDHAQIRVVLSLMKAAREKQLLRFFEWLGRTGPEVTMLLYDRLFRLCLVYAVNVDTTLDVETIAQQLGEKPELKNSAMTIAQRLRIEGRLEGRQEGLWIGKVQLLQKLAQLPITPSEELEALSVEELQKRFEAVERLYDERFKV